LVDFIRDFSGYVDNLLAPEKRATNPSSSDIINGFGLENDNQYNEFQSDSSASDNTANASLSFGIDIGFKFSKLPWTVNECVRTHLTCAVSVVSEVNGCR
jgi:hypothetical protein